MHIMLIDIYCVQHVEAFVKYVLEMINFEVVDTQEFILDNTIVDVKESEPIDIHFEASGYETSSAILNIGTVLYVIAMTPFFLGVMYLFSLICCCTNVRNCFKNRLKKTFFNGMIMFVDGILLLVATAAWINIYQVHRGVIKSTFSYRFSIAVLVITCVYSVAICLYLLCRF